MPLNSVILNAASRQNTLSRRRLVASIAATLLLVIDPAPASADTAARTAPLDFNRDVRPILSENCFHCHGPDAAERKADLRLDTPEGILADLGGHQAVVPGDPAKSELFARITHTGRDELMPPPKSKRVLTPDEIQALTRWIEEGAPWATHWAFVPPQRPTLPEIEDRKSKIENPIDRFIRARLAAEGLELSPPADPRTLIRRMTLDLTGLPPTPEEVEDFVSACKTGNQQSAIENLADRLLASPRYGERMVWEWLDAARYADSNGYQGDPERTMWPWRDWVIRALNENMPFDQFTIEQLAGDLLPNPTLDQKLATGFNRNHMHNGEGGRIAEETRVENLFDRTETTATIWLGLTMTCCRCHDHKYDPISQKEYYQLLAYFDRTNETGGGRGGKIAPVLDLASPEELERVKKAAAKIEALGAKVDEVEFTIFPRPEGKTSKDSPRAKDFSGNIYISLDKPAAKRGPEKTRQMVADFKEIDPAFAKRHQQLKDAMDARDRADGDVTRVMVMEDVAEPRETFILERGAYNKPTTPVAPAIPAILPALEPGQPPNRLTLARWLVGPGHPLTARVTVNRYWQLFFGNGLVKTTEDFGTQGSPPSHPEILDDLAIRFIESGWDVKALHRLNVTSATYRHQSHLSPALRERDPANLLLARGPRYRLPSWMIRDQALAASGLFVGTIGGPPVKPYQPPGIWQEATFGKITYIQDEGEALYRRSLYTFWRRIVGPTMFFDVSNRNVCSVKPSLTNTPLHALTLLNETTYVEAARALAERLLIEAADRPAARSDHAYRLTLGRPASNDEKKLLTSRLDTLHKEFAAHPDEAASLLKVGESPRDESLDPIEHASYAALCSLILNLDETLTKQ